MRGSTRGSKGDVVEILDSGFEGAEEVAYLMDRAWDLKNTIGSEAKEGPGSGLLGELRGIKERLAVLQIEAGQEVIRHNDVMYKHSLRQRSGVDTGKFVDALLSEGVTAEVIARAEKAALTHSEYEVHELKKVKGDE